MAETTGSTSPSLHIVVFPWLAMGHMIPFLELSKRLATRGHAVTFVSTPRNAARLGLGLGSVGPPGVRVVALDLPAVDGLPEGAESTADVPRDKVGLLKKAFDGLAAPFAALLAGFSRKPDWLVLDFTHYWAWPIAEEHQIPCAMFIIFAPSHMAITGPEQENEAHPRRTTEDYMAPPPWIPSPCPSAYRRGRHEAERMAAAFRPNASGVADVGRLWAGMHRPICRLVLYRSCPEVELEPPPLFPLLTKLFSKPAVPAGLLLPDGADDDESSSSSFAPAMRWLDEQPRGSVVYVALGSEAPVTAEQLGELALGLELSGARFLWALPRLRERRLLPEGFEARVAGRGVVSSGWVPQKRALAHGAVDAFLTHCGWGSAVESLRFGGGHPLVMLPFVADQGLVARAMEARGVGVMVPRDEGDESFDRDGVAAAVRRAMSEEEGKVLARNAAELGEIVADTARQERYVDELVEQLQLYK
ncbi:UDP-glycosyltransferase 91B1 isoform X2 [Brachypodium distachyon]|uniref:UDP-glycosyltransferase 91B1 isoform X2 n=1 Tax=Brachypodium distachyon TaxID=15368 RepID=UPI000234FA66|nr:UDP-glycosyltransferase 91B1 isoform X2 [Brachypodium distachyon]|eukprot:XP_024315163.1 UDP-glycosyltransferase 91B1 isoform X2 [Brachypodium distachyon]